MRPEDHRQTKAGRHAALCRAWNKATEDEQARFLVALGWVKPT